jgi:hypothetical protein
MVLFGRRRTNKLVSMEIGYREALIWQEWTENGIIK